MTRSNYFGGSRKSSVYNTSGQTYFEQLSAYNHMTNHIRKVLAAKSVVDTRNKRYYSGGKRASRSRTPQKSSDHSINGDLISRLACNPDYSPLEFLKMTWNFKSPCSCDREKYLRPGSDFSAKECRCDHSTRSSSSSRTRVVKSSRSPPMSRKTNVWSERHRRCFESTTPTTTTKKLLGEPSPDKKYSRPKRATRKCKDREDSICSGSTVTNDFLSKRRGGRGKRTKGVEELSSPDRSYEMITRRLAAQEDAKYAKFVYDITQEIVQKGTYTDKELCKIFKRHMKNNMAYLNESKMRYEIYQLKISLNIPDDSEDDDDCGLWQAQPPTPPKVLDEDKALAKLQNYLAAESVSTTFNLGTKSVILIDANPEMLITERDILLTLVDMNVDPGKADRICRKLLMRSRDQTSSLDSRGDKESSDSSPDGSPVSTKKTGTSILKRKPRRKSSKNHEETAAAAAVCQSKPEYLCFCQNGDSEKDEELDKQTTESVEGGEVEEEAKESNGESNDEEITEKTERSESEDEGNTYSVEFEEDENVEVVEIEESISSKVSTVEDSS